MVQVGREKALYMGLNQVKELTRRAQAKNKVSLEHRFQRARGDG